MTLSGCEEKVWEDLTNIFCVYKQYQYNVTSAIIDFPKVWKILTPYFLQNHKFYIRAKIGVENVCWQK